MNTSSTYQKIATKGLFALFVFLIAATITDKLLFNYIPFWGLENEDAYIYADTARFMTYHYPWSVDRFMTKSISSGSLTHSHEVVSYATHSEAFSIVIAFLHKTFGYWCHTPLLISSISAITSFLILSMIALKQENLPRERLLLCVIAFITSPLARAFQSSGVSEVLSSLFVLVTLLAFIRYANPRRNSEHSWLLVVISIFAYTSAVLVKRDNIILMILPFLAILNSPHLLRSRRFLCSFIGIGIITSIYLLVIPPMKSVASESADIQTSAFSINHFLSNAPRFIECILRLDMWGVTGYMLIASIILSRGRLKESENQFPLVLICVYLLAYTFHFRSRFQVANGNVIAFEMMRFSTNIFPIAVLSIVNMRIPKVFYSRPAIVTLSALLPLMVIYSTYHKVRLSHIEFIERTEPIKYAISLCSKNSILITDVASLARIYAEEDLDVTSTESLSSGLISAKVHNGTVKFVIVNRPNELQTLNELFNSHGCVAGSQIKFHSYDVNVYNLVE